MSASLADPRRDLGVLARLPDEAIDLAEAGLALAALDHPRRDRADYRTMLAEMGAAVARRAGRAETAAERAELLAGVLAGDYGLVGDDRDDDDLDDGDLMQLLDRRRGPPLTIGLVWLHVARCQGWPAEPLTFPGPFLLRLTGAVGERVIIDPFRGGWRLDSVALRELLKARSGAAAELTPEHYATLSNRALLLRLQTTRKLRCLRHAQLARAVAAVEAALLFAPDQAPLWREAGMMHLRQGNLPAAIAALEQFVARAPNSQVRHRTCVLLQDLRRRLAD